MRRAQKFGSIIQSEVCEAGYVYTAASANSLLGLKTCFRVFLTPAITVMLVVLVDERNSMKL